MFKRLLFSVALALCALSGTVHATHAQTAGNAWYLCKFRYSANFHGYSSRACWTVPMPLHHEAVTGWTINRTMLSARVMRTVRYPVFYRPAPAVQHAVRVVSRPAISTPAVGSYQTQMLVTWYGATGSPMANGIYPSVGWVACGYDLPLGARVTIAGIPGTFTCGDRIGFQPWNHIDVFGLPVGAGYREVTVYR